MKICRMSFATSAGTTAEGTIVKDDDPRVASNPSAFADLDVSVEEATSRPGGSRNAARKRTPKPKS